MNLHDGLVEIDGDGHDGIRITLDDDGNVIKLPGAQYQDNGVQKQY